MMEFEFEFDSTVGNVFGGFVAVGIIVAIIFCVSIVAVILTIVRAVKNYEKPTLESNSDGTKPNLASLFTTKNKDKEDEMTYCDYCGAVMKKDDGKCSACGAKVRKK